MNSRSRRKQPQTGAGKSGRVVEPSGLKKHKEIRADASEAVQEQERPLSGRQIE